MCVPPLFSVALPPKYTITLQRNRTNRSGCCWFFFWCGMCQKSIIRQLHRTIKTTGRKKTNNIYSNLCNGSSGSGNNNTASFSMFETQYILAHTLNCCKPHWLINQICEVVQSFFLFVCIRKYSPPHFSLVRSVHCNLIHFEFRTHAWKKKTERRKKSDASNNNEKAKKNCAK